MAKYLLEAKYTAEGARGLLKEGGTSRQEAVEGIVKKAGGKVEAFYYAFGPSDVYVIVDLPDTATAVALSLAVNQAGAVELKSHPLLTPAEIDKAAKISIGYRPPGK